MGPRASTRLLAPAIAYASDGIPNYEYMLDRLELRQQLRSSSTCTRPGGWDVFYREQTDSRRGNASSCNMDWLTR